MSMLSSICRCLPISSGLSREADYGQVIVDECHHISAVSFEAVLKQAKARFLLGLTATPVRKDVDQPVFMIQCGPIVFKDKRPLQERHPGVSHVVLPPLTEFFQSSWSEEQQNFQELCAELAADAKQNDLIVSDLLTDLPEKRSPLVITERLDHLELLAAKLEGVAQNVLVLRGGMSSKEMKELRTRIQAISDDEQRVILASGKCAGEGFDDPRLAWGILICKPIAHANERQSFGNAGCQCLHA
jgi:superfamily II DNA or RNA helicase